MAITGWDDPVNGDWSAAADWSTGAVPLPGDAAIISATGEPYTVTVSSADFANSLAVNADSATLLENSGSLTITGGLYVHSGLVQLNKANSMGSVTLTGGALTVGNAGALGTATVTQSGGELLGTANETLTNALNLSGSVTIAAAHGTTLTEKASSYIIAGSSTLNFGAPGQDGTVVWAAGNSTTVLPVPAINVEAGTLKGSANGELGAFLEGKPVTVAGGATLDLAGNSAQLKDLTGSGSIIDSGAAATLTLDAANFSGTISGPLSLEAQGAVFLSGNNTYAGTTTIDPGANFELGDNGTTGSIGGGAIVDNGALFIFRSNAITLTNAISGSGVLWQTGSGVTSINKANTYTGGTKLAAGTLAIGNGGALGAGALSQSGGELLATANETLTNPLVLSGATFAAAHGKTLTIKAPSYNVLANSTLNFGAAGQDGTVLWDPTSGSITTPYPAIDVQAGTLKGGNNHFGDFIAGSPISVAAGASLDLAGNSSVFAQLTGGGSITNSGAAATLTLYTANFSGTISGAVALTFNSAATLSGLEDTTGGATFNGAFTLTNAGTYDVLANTNINGAAGSSFVNDHIFEKTGGGGVSLVTSNFVNNGTLNVLSGSVQFTGGFTNHGVIHGRVTQSGGVTTVSALVPSDFDEDGKSNILWQNASTGQASIWDMNGNTRTGGGAVSSSPGPSWKAIGAGDFSGDGHADILWQNADGQASIWEMDGNTKIGGGAVSANPGPSWGAVGAGDFNGDGLSDILWQNTSTSQVSIWEMNGNTRTGGGAVSTVPGPNWKAIGTGDFNGDGDSDILFQNTSTSQVSIWEMNGNTRIGGSAVSTVPGPNWKAIGTGDFNGDGLSDILFQNTSTSQVSIWEMNGNSRIGGGAVSPIPGPNWKAVGAEDFNGDGLSDILWQNTTSGQASIWEMNGNTLIDRGALSPNTGSSWRAVDS
ncbi:MAG TPA: FG-GAP-like repeat-containing protein [Roseiarcus sp.]